MIPQCVITHDHTQREQVAQQKKTTLNGKKKCYYLKKKKYNGLF